MKIFYPLEVFFPSQAGGPANTIYWITKNLIKQGFQPIIVATDKGLPSNIKVNKWLETDGGKVIYIKTHFLNFPFYQTFISLSNFYRSDIVHISSFFFPTAFLTAFAARFLRKKLIWSARGELDTQALNYSRFRKKPILWLIKNLIGTYSSFHSTCDEETQYIKNIFGEAADIRQIPNYIELPDQVERNATKYLLYIGRIHPKKAIENLIVAISRSPKFLQSDFVIKIAGKGKPEFETELHNLVKELNLSEKIIFVGQVEGATKQKLLADAYFTIMPSHTENFGNVVLESLAQSTPVIASKGSPWQVLEDEKIGFWTENSPETLSVLIEQILELKTSVYEEYRQRSRKFVEREFNISNNINKWVEFYQSM
jgi:glycosyltransferase involved in cell wall biosynthesis